MPYEGEDPPYAEPDLELDELARSVIGAAIEVHRRMGPGLDESLCHAGLCVELRLRDVPFGRQVDVPVLYKGEEIGKRRLDLLVGGRLIVELKAVETLSPLHTAQLRTYLKITNLRLGLLINFNTIFLLGRDQARHQPNLIGLFSSYLGVLGVLAFAFPTSRI